MGLFEKVKSGLQKTHANLVHPIKRILTQSPRVTEDTLEELEGVLLGADFGMTTTTRLIDAIRKSYESQGKQGLDFLEVAKREISTSLKQGDPTLKKSAGGPTVISIVGVNGTGKTTTAARLAHRFQNEGSHPLLACCDTFRAAAIEQLQSWSQKLSVPVITGEYRSDPAAVAHDALSAATSRNADYLIIDTAGRLHTKGNLMKELQKLHRVIGKKLPDAPHEVLLVIDATTGMNALSQAREFHKALSLTGLVVTKLDGTSKGGIIVAIQDELNLPTKFIGLGEAADALQPFDTHAYTEALFGER